MTEKVYLNILQALPEPILVLLPNQVILLANNAARAIFSLTGEDLKGTCFSALVTDRFKFNDWIKKVTASSSFVSEQTELRTSGGIMPFVLDGCTVRDGKQAYLLIRLKMANAEHLTVRALSVQVDKLQQEIAMRRAAEERLQESLIELERAKRQLEQLATIDSLTGIPNRRSIDETLQREWLKAMRNAEPLAVMMIDIDHFKNYNDFYGHQAGDMCLKQVAHAIRTVLRRSTDYVGRYGGEEFLVLLTNSDSEKAKKMAGKICDAVRHLNIPHLASMTAEVVTISIGLNVITPMPSLSTSLVIQQADEALYEAKRNGRNQFVLHQKPVKVNLHRKKHPADIKIS
ncbi:MAG: diguanylate cyclase domain-containing protein [Chloroherpetonaceae bacterium]